MGKRGCRPPGPLRLRCGTGEAWRRNRVLEWAFRPAVCAPGQCRPKDRSRLSLLGPTEQQSPC
eukprot:3024741-Alexandrium_andersonii.AAC.1